MKYILEKTGISTRFERWRTNRQAQQKLREGEHLQVIDENNARLFGKKNWEWAKANKALVGSLGGEFSNGWLHPQAGGLEFIVILFKQKNDVDIHTVREHLQQIDPHFSEIEFQKRLGNDPWIRSVNNRKIAREVILQMLERDGIFFTEVESPLYLDDIRMDHSNETRQKQ